MSMKRKMLHRSFELYVADMESWYARPLKYHSVRPELTRRTALNLFLSESSKGN
jgi:hypothetical protein